MADINVERKGPSVWPWIIGLLVLALLIWAIAEMVDTDETQVAEVEEVEPAGAPAAVPAPTVEPGAAQAVELGTLMPLGTEDAGRTVTTRGTVVGQPIEEGYWILTDQDAVLFVVTEEKRNSGESVHVTGRLAPVTGDRVRTWRERANLRPAAGWTIHEDLFIAPLEGGQQAAPGTTAPGTTGAQQPADTGTGAAGTTPMMGPGSGSSDTTRQSP